MGFADDFNNYIRSGMPISKTPGLVQKPDARSFFDTQLANAQKTQAAPPASVLQGGSVNRVPTAKSSKVGGGPSAADIAAANAADATAKAMAAGKAQTLKQNQNTQAIIDALMGSLSGFATGRDTQITNANAAMEAAFKGIQSTYDQALENYNGLLDQNEQDEASKTAANITNRARERMSLLQQAATQGAGETDQLRAQVQAFLNADQNQSEVDRAFFDTQGQINSQVAGANSQAEAQRRSAYNQNQEAIGSAWNDFWKNQGDTWTNIQRTAAGNANTDTDYSTGFNAQFGGKDPVKEAAAAAGQTYKIQDKEDDFFTKFANRQDGRQTQITSTNRAGTSTIKAPKAAEGATLRGRG
jgi:hypothetical protein